MYWICFERGYLVVASEYFSWSLFTVKSSCKDFWQTSLWCRSFPPQFFIIHVLGYFKPSLFDFCSQGEFCSRSKIKFMEICLSIYKASLQSCSKVCSLPCACVSPQTSVITSQKQNFIVKGVVTWMGRRFTDLLFHLPGDSSWPACGANWPKSTPHQGMLLTENKMLYYKCDTADLDMDGNKTSGPPGRQSIGGDDVVSSLS